MYWPIGSPNVYALSRHAIAPARVTSSHAGLPESNDAVNGRTRERTGPSETPNTASTHSFHDETRDDSSAVDSTILSSKLSRGGTIFATLTAAALTVWQTKPAIALATITRSAQSLKAYGSNFDLLFRPDALVIIVRTIQNYLIVYSVAADPNAHVLQVDIPSSNRTARKSSIDGYVNYRKQSMSSVFEAGGGPAEGDGFKEVNLRFRMVMRIDAGISELLALDDELVVATKKPAALQCIRWPTSDSTNPRSGPQTSTELLSKISWIPEKSNVVKMIYDRPMNLACWITSDGCAHAVQRRSPANVDMDNPASLFQGYCFRKPDAADSGTVAVNAAINARFSLIAVGCEDGEIDVYVVKDYLGNIPLSFTLRLPVSRTASGALQCLSYSPDGYCLFAGYEQGWALWSVYGKPGANSFSLDRPVSNAESEQWLHGVTDAFWIGNGCELVILGKSDDRLWSIDIARSATTGCFAHANLLRGLLLCSGDLKLYRGHDAADPMTLSSDMSLWQDIQIPASYLLHQWPMKCAVVSPDCKYIAVAGRRGLAHYSILSGRWRTFDDLHIEREFTVRGGMCWYRHYLIACVEDDAEGKSYEIRVYSREKALDNAHIQYSEALTAPAVWMSTSGPDSLLVYTHENTLLHFIIVLNNVSIRLVQVGNIGFHGIIRAPPRVRAISWILPEEHLMDGDPSQDVAKASALFLVDGKLVLLQPSTNEQGELKYDMKVIAQNVEYFFLLRDLPALADSSKGLTELDHYLDGLPLDGPLLHSLRDSLWYFEGTSLHVWIDVQDVLASASAEAGRDLPSTIRISIDFYPLFAMDNMGIVTGLDTDLVQRKDVDFSFFRLSPRSQLFLPQLLRHHLAQYDSPAALHLSQSFQHLPYFPHALEVLLHDVLDAEVDSPPASAETAVLPMAISFLSSFPSYLEVIVNCTRKTELRSWKTLFSYLPPVMELFEQSLLQARLKTAAGYLLVFHTLQGEGELGGFQGHEYARLLRAAIAAQDWELCGELARFLVGIDDSGKTLQAALSRTGLVGGINGREHEQRLDDFDQEEAEFNSPQRDESIESLSNGLNAAVADYFSLQRSGDEQNQDEAG